MTHPKRTKQCADCGVSITSRATRCRWCQNRRSGIVKRTNIVPPNPSGQCGCGCGQMTTRSKITNNAKGLVRGEHAPYCKNHNGASRGAPLLTWVVDEETGCWNWSGALDKNGYGAISCRFHGRKPAAHRYVYIVLHGDPGPKLVLDHLCFNPRCVNPDHLEPVTQRENLRRARERRHAVTSSSVSPLST
jgi:HNH endonuclease